ncbi:nicotinate-nucleotide adenylyltransferase [Methylacidimicrobium cyclopophantes]|uniref:Probable nicotinate-nucleotide adenylyltransferase n=1 Tax=Methylacidimicrobium cyclopophantes TaxID=1041766 RepID=A0A5E6MBG4_9BACT|nr:nicotinate-nucleotide adenylyltransferase [Methylacidimicrobium cyclopophantes]VVM06529.1 nicotinate-nucleotide adenylyltransferase [Methylacidimicrobium cyclopophantes]
MRNAGPTAKKHLRPLRLGLFGGSFDPIHHGHLIGAWDALEQMRLDRILFIPCSLSPHKSDPPVAPGEERLAMIRRAIRGWSAFSLSDCELVRGGPSFSVDTAEQMRSRFPVAELFWLIGSDQAQSLPSWKDYSRLRKLVTFLVVPRPRYANLVPEHGMAILPSPHFVDISSTEIRERAANGLPVGHLVPRPVAAHIAKRRLYEKSPA